VNTPVHVEKPEYSPEMEDSFISFADADLSFENL
jgi:hypothetical protein